MTKVNFLPRKVIWKYLKANLNKKKNKKYLFKIKKNKSQLLMVKTHK